MKKVKFALLVAVFGFGLAVSLFPISNALAKSGTRLECKALGPGDTSMDARYEEKDGREKLSISFEAAPGGSFVGGNVVVVTLNGEFLGNMILSQPGGIGDVEGDLNYDTTADPDDDDLPFPSIDVGGDSVIKVVELGCPLTD
jgi:hypothetical protein